MEQSKYENIRSQQNLYFFENLKNILNEIKPHRIIEIGTARGATTLYMSDLLTELKLNDTKIKTFDIIQRDHLIDVERDNIEFYIGNTFNYSLKELSKPEEIVNFLSNDGTNLIMCDGGNKILEFEILSKYLKKGDVIMAHDYAPNKEVFEKDYKDKIWNWMEITDNDINEAVKEYNLESYKMDLIKPTAWVAKIKK
jgi:predicted O-methyltransferase YrrM